MSNHNYGALASEFDYIEEMITRWRMAVASTESPYRQKDEDYFLGLVNDWINDANALIQAESVGSVIDEPDWESCFKKQHEKALLMRSIWIKPVKSGSPAYTNFRLSKAEAEQLNQILKTGSAKLKINPKKLSE